MEDKGKVSIILPCHRAEKYLAHIISDVVSQSYQNWELIIVSNGNGQEKQVKVVQPFLAKDSRIRLIEDEIGGVSRARNTGINATKGTWITFIDADDRIEPNHIQNYMEVVDDESELVVMGFTQKFKNKTIRNIIGNSGELTDSKITGLKETKYELLSLFDMIYAPVWNKLFSMKVITENDLRFNTESFRLEDELFCLKFISICRRIQLTNNHSYIYNDLSTSATKRYAPNFESSLKLVRKQYDAILATLHIP